MATWFEHLRLSLLTLLVFGVVAGRAHAAEYHVAVGGDDAAAGSSDAPWRTLQTAVDRLTPGDVLSVHDGVYLESVQPHVSGTPGAPIFIRAVNPFAVTIDAQDAGTALNLFEVSHLEVEGFRLRGNGNRAHLAVNSRDGQPDTGDMATHHIVLRKMSVRGSCLQRNCNAAFVARSNDVLLEDVWVYGAGRYGFLLYGSKNVTVRRMVVRWDQWYGDEDQPNDPRTAFGVYNAHDNIIENLVLIDAGLRPPGHGGDKAALALAGGNTGSTAPWVSSVRNQFFGVIIYNNIGRGFDVEARSSPHDNNVFRNCAVWENSVRAAIVNKNVNNTVFDHMTWIRHLDPVNAGGYANWSSTTMNNQVMNSIVAFNMGRPFRGEVTRSYNVVFGNEDPYTPGEGSLEIDPELVYALRNDTAPLIANPGSDGKRRGAHLLYRYQDGVETDEPMWPWPYEAEIREDFCDPATLAEFERTGDNAAAWCETDKTLTAYLWEGYGDASCPEEICRGSGPPVPDGGTSGDGGAAVDAGVSADNDGSATVADGGPSSEEPVVTCVCRAAGLARGTRAPGVLLVLGVALAWARRRRRA